MFTGIIEATGTVSRVLTSGSNKTFWVESPFSHFLQPDQSLAHDGVCLTVEAVEENRHQVTAVAETLEKSTLGSWTTGTLVNLERCLELPARLDGHLVQGHVDTTARCMEVVTKDGSWEYSFQFDPAHAALLVEKGSVSLNGISLTVFHVQHDRFTVAIIPYTYAHTNIRNIQPGSVVNLEFDIVGKYVLRNQQLLAGK
ncbi:MAG TPA: riboflavin synthase [Lacibacter sp.]|nr:riboflavin synthase [Lacibacter sp.]HMO89501.1 riboflavin synthase [Lacibacter sp.]